MNLASLPAPVLAKLLSLDEGAEFLEGKAKELAWTIANLDEELKRQIVRTSNHPKQLERKRERERLNEEREAVVDRLRNMRNVSANCRTWLEELPAGTVLDQVTTSTDGESLKDVRAKIKAARDEINKLERAPVPAPDLRMQAERYVAAQASPKVWGIRRGEGLKVQWPGQRDTSDRNFDVLALAALIAPEKLVDAIMAKVDEIANYPIPVAQRPARIAVLEAELEALSYTEEALIAAALERGESVRRSPSALPQAVLGVRVVQREARAA